MPRLSTHRQLLVFNQYKRLVGVFNSITAGANVFDTSTSNIHAAANGQSLAAHHLYWRYWDMSVLPVLPSDFSTIRLQEYDKKCGVKRKYYPNAQMTRKGMKYKKQNKPKPTPNRDKVKALADSWFALYKRK